MSQEDIDLCLSIEAGNRCRDIMDAWFDTSNSKDKSIKSGGHRTFLKRIDFNSKSDLDNLRGMSRYFLGNHAAILKEANRLDAATGALTVGLNDISHQSLTASINCGLNQAGFIEFITFLRQRPLSCKLITNDTCEHIIGFIKSLYKSSPTMREFLYGETRWNAKQRLKWWALLSKMRSSFRGGRSEGDEEAMLVTGDGDGVDGPHGGVHYIYTSSVPHKAELYSNWDYDRQNIFSNARTTGYHSKVLQKAASVEGAQGGNCLAGACEMTDEELLEVLATDHLDRAKAQSAQAAAAAKVDEGLEAPPKKIKKLYNKVTMSQFQTSTVEQAFLHTLLPSPSIIKQKVGDAMSE